MKSCPSCHQTYEDEAMLFCLADGAELLVETIADVPQATLVFPPPTPVEPGPTFASPQPTAQPTMLVPPELVRLPPPAYSSAAPGFGPPERARTSALPWLFGIAIVLGLSGIVIALIVTRSGGGPNQQTVQSSTPAASPARSGVLTAQSEQSPSPESKESPRATPATPIKSPERQPGSATVNRALPKGSPPERSESRPKPMFAVMNNTSFNGSRITYYPRPSFALCQADCAGNANCKGFTWIRPGAYNPGDSAMCYLMSAVTARVAHACCISAVRN